MTQEIINVGTTANDGQGDPLRVAFEKVNNNFTQLFGTGFSTVESITFGNTTQELFSIDANLFTEGTFQINSVNPNNQSSQNIIIVSAIQNDLSNVKYTGQSSITFGDYVSNYSMDVVSGNVVLYSTPFVTGQLNHFIAYQIILNQYIPGISLSVQQGGNIIGTQNLQPLTTQQP
jgi:hypothetical protein